jgi:NADPH-dependent curcumin reductase
VKIALGLRPSPKISTPSYFTSDNERYAMTETLERIVLASRPVGEPTIDNFRLEKLPIPQSEPGQMLLRTVWLSLDPYMRGRMSDAPSYAKPVGIGDAMEGGTVSEVVASNLPRFAKGDIVVGRTGWQTHALSDGSGLQKVDPTRAPIQTALGVLGMPGMTAYVGLLEIGKPAAGETVVVAAASGAVGRLSARSPASKVPTPSASPEDQRNAVT